MKKVLKDGKWIEGKASPEHLREDLRKLPGDFVTKDISEGDKIHELDAPHIVEALTDDQAQAAVKEEKETVVDKVKKLKCAPVGRKVKLNQWEIDCVRIRVIHALLGRFLRELERGECPDIFAKYYIWFPENDVNHYMMRHGNPPSNKDRPKHLKRYDLHLDVFNWPRRIKDVLKEDGMEIPSKDELLQQLQEAYYAPRIIVP